MGPAASARLKGQSVLKYDLTERQFVQNWVAPSTKGSCFIASHWLDGVRIAMAEFQVK